MISDFADDICGYYTYSLQTVIPLKLSGFFSIVKSKSFKDGRLSFLQICTIDTLNELGIKGFQKSVSCLSPSSVLCIWMFPADYEKVDHIAATKFSGSQL